MLSADENNVNGHHLPSPVKDPSPEEEKTMTTSKIIVHGFAWKRIGIFLKLGLPGMKLIDLVLVHDRSGDEGHGLKKSLDNFACFKGHLTTFR